MLFNKELSNNKLILVNLKFIKSFIITLQLDLTKLVSFTKMKLFKTIKTFLHIAISKRKRKDHDVNFKKSLIKML